MLNAKTRCILYYRDIGYSKPKGGGGNRSFREFGHGLWKFTVEDSFPPADSTYIQVFIMLTSRLYIFS